jgi:hypothetical protein
VLGSPRVFIADDEATAGVALGPNNALLWYNWGITARYTTRLGQSLRDFE